MRKVSRRSVAVLLIALLVLVGLASFLMQYALKAKEWVTFPGSPHVYKGNNLTTGAVYDRAGRLLLENNDGSRVYAADETLRKATLHLLGDRYGYIPSTVLSAYADQMAGFSAITGVYGAKGAEMTLTVSAAAQTAAYEAMDGRHGCVVVYNYKTGEILCLLSAPSYDPDNMPDIENDTTGQYDGAYVNRAVASTYTPGSIFKLVTAAAALEQIEGLEQRTFTCNGAMEIGGETVRCLNVHGTISFAEGLAKSCNIVFGQLAVELGAQTLAGYATQLGVSQRITFDGLTTAAGNVNVAQADDWALAWAGIGQHTDQINPLQFATLVGAIAGGGQAAKPYLVASVGDRYEAKPVMLERTMEETTAAQLAALMVNNVQTVYGSWNFPTVTVGAKSGTAEQGGDVLPNATFAGFVQDEDYPLAFVVVVEKAGAGSETCIPIVNAVLQACIDEIEAKGALLR